MKTKTIPFDLETALDIQKGRTKGRIITKLSESVRIVFWGDKEDSLIVALVNDGNKEEARCYTLNGNLLDAGNLSAFDLVIEVPDDEPQFNEPKFKPFDKVLVRTEAPFRELGDRWTPAYFQMYSANYMEVKASGEWWQQCIPYEGNEDLVRTTENPKEE